MENIVGWFLSLLPAVFGFYKWVFPKLSEYATSLFSSGGVIATILGAVIKLFLLIVKLPMLLVDLISRIPLDIFKLFTKFMMNYRYLAIISMVLSNYFSNLIENIFLIVGVVSIKIALILVKWGKTFIDNMQQNNAAELKTILGDSVGSLPPCMIDVMGYMHVVQNIGMLVTTLIFCGVVKIIYAFVIKVK